MKAGISPDGRVVMLRGSLWKGEFPIEDLPRWIAFYERMRRRRNGAYARHYDDTLRALKKVQQRVKT